MNLTKPASVKRLSTGSVTYSCNEFLDHVFTGRTLTRKRRLVLESCAVERMAKAGSGLPNTSAHR